MCDFALQDDVYLVQGAKKHAIYDFNKSRLYNINQSTLRFIRNCISKRINFGLFSTAETESLDCLLKNEILIPTEKIKPEVTIESKYPSENNSLKSAWIEVTNICNLKCKHCYSPENNNPLGSMDYKTFSKVVFELSSIGVEHVQIIGGEPLILKDKIKKMLLLSKNFFKTVKLWTNATLIDKDWAIFFSENRIVVNTTIFSYSSVEHDKVTRYPDSHSKTHQAIGHLKDAGCEYLVNCVRMNGVEIENKRTDLYDLHKRCDVVRNCGRADLGLLNKELLYKKLITKQTFSKPLLHNLSKLLVSGHNCFSKNIYISQDQNLYPCPMERKIHYGSLKEDKLSTIIKNAVIISKSVIRICKHCEYRYACVDCRPDRLEDDIYAKPWYCTYDPYTAEWFSPEEFVVSKMSHLN